MPAARGIAARSAPFTFASFFASTGGFAALVLAFGATACMQGNGTAADANTSVGASGGSGGGSSPDSYYHMNWKIYAKRVECPTHLMEVTGCKLAPQGLPPVNPAVATPEQAAADPSFKPDYTITTMQDCCMPTCAWRDNTIAREVKATGQYNSFYACDENGVPVTEPATP